jgi:hypothetical protein
LETKFRPNQRIFVFWRSFWIQNGHHNKPKWSQYGAACLTPCKYPFLAAFEGLKKIKNGGRYHGNQGAKNVKFTPNSGSF